MAPWGDLTPPVEPEWTVAIKAEALTQAEALTPARSFNRWVHGRSWGRRKPEKESPRGRFRLPGSSPRSDRPPGLGTTA